ncbi:LysM peptidoglycan-binding domain-containing protein [Wielerella bovis]|uniref:LysM peptidoglycan-binding domain-containing protein n=1 Tax=Wielerella bovis TaxID=2917790 RepID=UPI0020196FBD|nr:LysM domain-containing protein [Wielerella bovis]MCG7656769.1 LysM peptidoglycan-binding domain-containing protein [Wielerella bovis]MCG7658992.1 LysM peptidoglycan-binding domain-containing protein [Wielerella bovis]
MKKSIITLLCAAGMIISNSAIAENLRVRPGAPSRYTVKQGDTLWSISGKYLYRPWKWHALWGANRSKIRNPHLIYPGQTLVLSYVNGKPRLGVDRSRSGGIPTIKLSPRVRDLGSGYGIPSINVDFYRMFMKTPQFMSAEELTSLPRLVSSTDNRLYFSDGDRVYADGIDEPGTYMILRAVRELKDPRTKASLGMLMEFAGEASTLSTPNSALSHRSAEAQAALHDDEYFVKNPNGSRKPIAVRTAQPMIITGALSEIRKGDYLVKRPSNYANFHFMPHETEGRIDADIVDIMDGVAESGTMQTLILNKGLANGLEPGSVLGIYRRGKLVQSDWENRDLSKSPYVVTPNQEIGLAMVYRANQNVSSAIIIESIANISRDDLLSNPGQDLDTFGNEPNEALKDPTQESVNRWTRSLKQYQQNREQSK